MAKKKETSIQFTSKIYKLKYLLDVHYVEVPMDVIKTLGGKLKIRLLCSINGNPSFQCGMVALGSGNAYISVNKKRMKEFGIKFGEKVKVALQKDDSKYGMDVPEELSELLKQDDEGNRRFKMLPPGTQRYIIYYVAQVKSSQLRINRAIKLITNLKKIKEGKEIFREILGLT